MQKSRFSQIISICLALATRQMPAITLHVQEDAGVSRSGAYVCNGIPISRALNWTNPAGLCLQTSSGESVPAQIEVLSRWAGGPDSGQPIQWLLLAFPCSPSASQTLSYNILQQQGPLASNALLVTDSPTDLVVNTGSGLFSIPKNRFSLFDNVSLSDGLGGWRSPIIGGTGQGLISVPGFPLSTAAPPEEVTYEHSGPLRVTVRVSGHYSPAPGSAGQLRYLLRHDFFAGSSGVDTDFHFDLPTDLQGEQGYEGFDTNAYLLLNRVSFSLPLSLQGASTGFVAAVSSTGYPFALAPGQTAGLSQNLRPAMTSAPSYTLRAAGLTNIGLSATHPLVAAAGDNGGVAASFRLMRLYEPQALSVCATSLVLDVVSTNQWLGPRQGASCRMRLQFIQPGDSFSNAREAVVAQLDHPLLAWPSPGDVAQSRVLGELWNGLPDTAAQHGFQQLQQACSNTLEYVTSRGMHGFMTHGLVPRYYANPLYGDEFGNPDTWDGYYLGATFTDYHNTFFNALRLFAMSGDRRLVHELCFPAARRTLSTLIVQGEPIGDFRTGWGSIGYGGYRQDNNSSHSYFQNLFAYYWLTGDRHVLDVLEQGASVRRFFYNRNPDLSLVPPEDPPLVDWEDTTGRMGSQRAAINWFLGHALDAGYLDDFRNQVERMAARHIALLTTSSGEECCFLFEQSVRSNPLLAQIQQPWMSALYPLENLWKFYSEYGDIPLSSDAILPSRIINGFERFVWSIAARVPPGGDGTASGDMANEFSITWTGLRLGGTYVTNNWVYVDPDSLLYVEGKSVLLGPLFRSSEMSDPGLTQWQQARALEDYVLAHPPASTCLDKITGQFFASLIPAMAYGTPPNTATNPAPQNDYDGDGRSDLAVFDPQTASWYAYSLSSESAIAWAIPWGMPGATTTPGDYDGDQATDLAVYDGTSRTWYVASLSEISNLTSQMRAQRVLAWAVPWGFPGAVTIPGDYDGDGKSDLAVYDTNAGTWYVASLSEISNMKSKMRAPRMLAWAVPWGIPGAVTIPGDYDGDGKSDLAVYDKATCSWYIMSLNGGVIAWAVSWGLPGAMIIPGDYDGDGKSDLAVFESNSGLWYIVSVSGSVIAWARPWGWPGAIPPGSRQ